jgi:hypothetical protein
MYLINKITLCTSNFIHLGKVIRFKILKTFLLDLKREKVISHGEKLHNTFFLIICLGFPFVMYGNPKLKLLKSMKNYKI